MLFVNLRGFDPDPTLPPADPAAVLDGFLRLLGMPGQQIPHGYLPLALGLVTGHIHNTPGWTLTDHADRLDERHRTANIVVSLFYLVTAGVTIVGETWVYYILGIVVEMVLLLAIARVAWTRPVSPGPLAPSAAAAAVARGSEAA